MNTRKQDRTVTCQTEECLNYNIPITLHDDQGATVICGGGCGNVIAEEADWYEPPTDEDLGIDPAPQRAADLIGSMTAEERQELAALIAGGETNANSQKTVGKGS